LHNDYKIKEKQTMDMDLLPDKNYQLEPLDMPDKNEKKRINEMMKKCKLTEVENKVVVYMVYGDNGKKLHQEDIAKKLSISQGMVSKSYKIALSKLKDWYKHSSK
jgi:DNA-directed RNA polymerase sigma subunit (sigma70/sigma32)